MLKSKSNMYRFIDERWNPVKGRCPFDCSYCYVKRWGNTQKPLHLDVKELRRDLGRDKFIFVCSGCDLFHPDVPGTGSRMSAIIPCNTPATSIFGTPKTRSGLSN